MDGLLIIDKPEGITSAHVVAVVKRRLHCKTGHLGTLDPFATGVLPVCLGEATKIAQFLNTADKEYSGVIQLGRATDTGDPTGSVVRTAPVPGVTGARLAEVRQGFLGEQMQVPPMYSAIKRDGTPLYKLAREGVWVERQPRRVRIQELALACQGADRIAFSVSCSKGTYVRVLAEEIAHGLGTVGHLATLRRTRFGRFVIDQAASLEALEAGSLSCLSLRAALDHLREIELAGSVVGRARQGYEPALASIVPGAPGEVAKLVDADGGLAAVIVMHESGRWRFARVFQSQTSK
jgi:tRNA pseudouridine55 synthase